MNNFTPDAQNSAETAEPKLWDLVRIHAETLGRKQMPASRELLRDAADEIERLTKRVEALESLLDFRAGG